jgi:DNA-binding SARP family transcriptional activator/tetratricopeptide (TPR) repeat protein
VALLPADADAALLCRLVTAGDRDGAVRLLVEHGDRLLDNGAGAEVLHAATQLQLGGDPDLLAVLGYARQLSGDWLGALAAYRAAAGDGPVQPRLAARYGQMCYIGGKVDEAIEVYERAVRRTPPTPDEIELRCYAAIWLRAAGQDAMARRTATEAATAAERDGHLTAAARGHWALALLAAHDGDRPEHDLHHRRGMRLAEQLDHDMLRLGLTINHASYLAEDGPPAEALAEAEAARRLCLRFGLGAYEPLCRSILARALGRLGHFDAALSSVQESLERWRDIGPSFDVAFAQIVRADIHCRRGEPGLAQAALAESLSSTGESAATRPMHAIGLSILARAQAPEDLLKAARTADEAVAIGTGTGRVLALLARGWVALLAGHRGRASEDAVAARTVAGERRDHGGVAEALELAVLSAPEPGAVTTLLDEAMALWRELRDPVGVARVRLIRGRLAGPSGTPEVAIALAELRRHGVRVDTGVAGGMAVPTAQPPISVTTLGAFEVYRDGTRIPAGDWRSKQARDLFKILVAQRGRPIARERLIGLLWTNESGERPANRLSVLLHRLRSVLDPDRRLPDPGVIRADRETVALDVGLVAVDVEAYLAAADAARAAESNASPDAPALLAAADAACGGDFLPEDVYSDWSQPLRDTIRTTHAAVLRALLRHSSDPDDRERRLLQLLAYDPYDETAHHQLIQVLHHAGRYGESRRRHREYVTRMEEIGVNPSRGSRLSSSA